MAAVARQQAVPSEAISPATGNSEREKDIEETMLELLKPFAEGLKEVDADLLESMSWRQLQAGIPRHIPMAQSVPQCHPMREETLW